ncbi:electron transporter RnfB [Photobacterium aquae]|uniref:Electron transfer flavoprotein subunit beta n=1 Tax=Photobacterium aquae TaxID=1195763 RepID=A0A0J1H0M5_9GAMM|nr:electron transfer flavoprotein subunit beta/FixA family protein [Photobacterium aquae]KLV05380.1 electron transporter RnfB [Photobacterium aquae]
MKVLVAIKRVVDPYVKIRVKSDGSGIDNANVKMTMNPFCEIAVEEAVRLKQQGAVTEIIVVCIGGGACQEQLRTALALGADRAIHVDAEPDLEPLSVAKLLHALIEQEKPQLILLGKQSIDTDNNQVAQMLAALARLPQGTFASKVVVESDIVTVTREVDGGLETLALTLPAVISTDLRLNEPRYASLPNIMKAKSKPLTTVTPQVLGVELHRHQKVIGVIPPPARQGGITVASVSELIDRLKNDDKVI